MYRIDLNDLPIEGGLVANGWLTYEDHLEWYGDIYDCDITIQDANGKKSSKPVDELMACLVVEAIHQHQGGNNYLDLTNDEQD